MFFCTYLVSREIKALVSVLIYAVCVITLNGRMYHRILQKLRKVGQARYQIVLRVQICVTSLCVPVSEYGLQLINLMKKKGSKELFTNPCTSEARNERIDGKICLCYRMIQIFAQSHKSQFLLYIIISKMFPCQFIYHLTDKFFVSCPAHPKPLIRNTGNYTLEDLHRQYTKYRHKHIKHTLL